MRRVERDQREVREPGAQDDLCRLRIDPDVELGGGRRVPGLVGAAHDDSPRDPLDDPRLEPDGQRDVGERTDRHQHDLVGRGEICVDEELGGTPRALDGPRWRDRQLARMHAAVAVEDLARDGEVVPQKRRGRPLVHRDVDPEEVEHAQCVVGAGGDRVVAVDGRRRDELQVGVEHREHERDRVVGAGVDVEDQLGRASHLARAG